MREIDKVKELIHKYKLDTKSKEQEKFMPRYYLMNFLRENTGLSLRGIGVLFNKEEKFAHCATIHAVRQHKALTACNDKVYKLYTENVRSAMSDTILRSKTEKHESSIVKEVLLCANYYEMVKLQNKIKQKLE